MTKQGYVSLGVAMCAALGVHAFIFFYTPHIIKSSISDKPLQLTLLPQVAEKKHAPKPISKAQTHQNITHHQHIIPQTPDLQKQRHVTKEAQTHTETTTQESDITHPVAVIMQKKVQQTILANIMYPKQALRKGWEGKAEFSLQIHQHMIQHVTMLASTGYDILDRAAQRGITSIHAPLPLHDGKHLLPVTFRLQ